MILLLVIFFLAGPVMVMQAQANQLAPGAIAGFQAILNNPSPVHPANVTAMGRSWFRLEIDSHVLSSEVSIRQMKASAEITSLSASGCFCSTS